MPVNPEAVSRLATAIDAATKPPPSRGIRTLPETALRISGKRYQLTANNLGLQTMGFAFPSGTEGVLSMTFADGRVETRPIGLDGVPRISAEGRFGLPVALSASWESVDTFVLNYNEVGNINMFRMKLTFGKEGFSVDVTERSDGAKFRFVGTELSRGSSGVTALPSH